MLHHSSRSDYRATTSKPLVSEGYILELCTRGDLRTFDPYDIWMTNAGFNVKNFYNHHRYLGLPGAASLTLFDMALGEMRSRVFLPREYPIVRSWAPLILLNYYERSGDSGLLEPIRAHLKWLRHHSCQGYSGSCWGLAFRYAVGKNLVYDVNTPLATMTPYALEAFCRYTKLTGEEQFQDVIIGIYQFFEHDIAVMEETSHFLVTSYAPFRDRRVVNAVSYALYCYSLLLEYIEHDQRVKIKEKIAKLYAFIRDQQRVDGSWLYSPDGNSFVDCFHSCIVLKNLIKASKFIALDNCEAVIHSGYNYIKQNFLSTNGLARRFSVSNKPSMIRYDLYDSAELMSLAALTGDHELVANLSGNIERSFVCGQDIYSQIDIFGRRRNKNMLRWAVMPYLHALSQLDGEAQG